MKRICLILILLSTAGLSLAEDQMSSAEIEAMKQRIKTVGDPAARLFFQANIYRAEGDLEKALQTLAELIVNYDYDKRWIARSELLTARFYLETGMFDAADVTARQIDFLYKGTDEAKDARRLREKIKQQKEESEQSEK